MLVGRLLRSFRRSVPLHRVEVCAVPQIGEGLAKLTITRWLVAEGETVSELQEICEAEGDKGTTNLFSKFTGVLTKVYVQSGADGNVGSPLYAVDVPDGSGAAKPATPAAVTPSAAEPVVVASASSAASSSHVLALPSARRLAKEKGIDLSLVKGSGKQGAIRKEDVLSYKPASSQPAAQPAPPAAATPASTTKKMTKIVRSMAKSMTESLKIPHLTFSDEVCMDNLIALRKQLNETLSKDRRLTFMPFFIKAMSLTMLEYPIMNSRLIETLEEYEEFPHHNISVAIDTPHGLIVPNIKSCEQKSLSQLQIDLKRLQDLGKENKVPLEDVLGGTVSLSNLGTLGGTHSVPVIFPPQVFIGGITGARPVLKKAKSGDILETSVLGVSWSADHRLIDGATTARFSQRWKEIIENPMLMLLSLK